MFLQDKFTSAGGDPDVLKSYLVESFTGIRLPFRDLMSCLFFVILLLVCKMMSLFFVFFFISESTSCYQYFRFSCLSAETRFQSKSFSIWSFWISIESDLIFIVLMRIAMELRITLTLWSEISKAHIPKHITGNRLMSMNSLLPLLCL